MVPIAGVLFALGYAMQAGLINPFIGRPEHSQFMLLVAVAIIMVNVLLIIFGPDAQSVRTTYAFDSFQWGRLIGCPKAGPSTRLRGPLDCPAAFSSGGVWVMRAALCALTAEKSSG